MQWLAYRYWRLKGWTFHGEIPDIPKMIAIGAPHTTNWDFVLYLAALHHYRIKVTYIGKHTLFRWPFGWFFRMFGGIPVDRSKPGGIVGEVARAFDAADTMILVMAPEGTRSNAPHWKSGFVNIAESADVPVVVASVDFARKQLTIGPTIVYKGDAENFMDRVRDFYANKQGLYPEKQGPIRLAEEAHL